jgi:hypothetical protein
MAPKVSISGNRLPNETIARSGRLALPSKNNANVRCVKPVIASYYNPFTLH